MLVIYFPLYIYSKLQLSYKMQNFVLRYKLKTIFSNIDIVETKVLSLYPEINKLIIIETRTLIGSPQNYQNFIKYTQNSNKRYLFMTT